MDRGGGSYKILQMSDVHESYRNLLRRGTFYDFNENLALFTKIPNYQNVNDLS